MFYKDWDSIYNVKKRSYNYWRKELRYIAMNLN